MIVVGAPVHQRAWILNHWFQHLSAQSVGPENLHILLNYGESSDDTIQIINEWREASVFGSVSTMVDKGVDHEHNRKWNPTRYETMVRLRNDLLHRVRSMEPEFYLSCDTDMLLPRTAIETLIERLDDLAGVGPLAHMTPMGSCPNAFGLNGNRWVMGMEHPTPTEQVYAVFGCVLMTPALYNGVDYEVHRQGEDIGWAKDAWGKQLLLGIVPEVKVKHVMNPAMLDAIDNRIGF